LAAMGALPRFAMLALSLPRIDEAWARRFAEGLWSALDEFDVALIGGNTTRGALSCSLTAFGEIELCDGHARALLRSGARDGDDVWVSGTLGDAGWALACMTGQVNAQATRDQIARYEMPVARIQLGLALQGLASSCIDISDGLISEANHIAHASNVSIDIEFARLPTSLGAALSDARLREQATHCMLSTGDAYELLFTAPPSRGDTLQTLLTKLRLNGHRIGRVSSYRESTPCARVQVRDHAGRIIKVNSNGWDHFA
jgi:thiamine-monophosphate kinase